jgi:hypothetical protein
MKCMQEQNNYGRASNCCNETTPALAMSVDHAPVGKSKRNARTQVEWVRKQNVSGSHTLNTNYNQNGDGTVPLFLIVPF